MTPPELIQRARVEQLTRPGEPFNAPARVSRLADLLVELANTLERLLETGVASR
jgi:hypothetical protein